MHAGWCLVVQQIQAMGDDLIVYTKRLGASIGLNPFLMLMEIATQLLPTQCNESHEYCKRLNLKPFGKSPSGLENEL